MKNSMKKILSKKEPGKIPGFSFSISHISYLIRNPTFKPPLMPRLGPGPVF